MANYKVPSFLRKEGDSLVFNQEGEFIFYVPEIYFDRGDAIIVGEYVNIIGIMDYAIFDKDGKNKGLKRFYFPTVFLTKPYQMDKMKNVKLTTSQPAKDYRLLRYKKDDVIVLIAAFHCIEQAGGPRPCVHSELAPRFISIDSDHFR